VTKSPIPSTWGTHRICCPKTRKFATIAAVLLLSWSSVTVLDAYDNPTPGSTTEGSNPIVSGRLVHQTQIKYPKDARKKKIEGSVVLQATIEKDGTVSTISIASGDVLLADAAVDEVRSWRFDPYTQGGQPIKVQQDLAFTFDLRTKRVQLDSNFALPTTIVPGKSMTTKPVERVYRVGGGVSAPKAIYAPDPNYAEKARKAKYQGVCVLSAIIGVDGRPRDMKVVRAIGEALDAKAVEAVSKWKFEPAMKDGRPVAVVINVEVQFRLY
jgi:TonB family protein